MPIRTIEAARVWRAELDKTIMPKIASDTAAINSVIDCISEWTAGTAEAPKTWAVNDVRKENGIPYRCVQAHTHSGEAGWNPANTPALWTEYHGTSASTARAWKAPTGAHDMYKVGEYMIWTDGSIYHCIVDTVYTPTDYAAAWEKYTS